jgi:hypothetical protein
VEVFNRRVVFETVLSENWFNGYIAVDSITHADGGQGGCETLPRAAEVSTVPPETTTTPGILKLSVKSRMHPEMEFLNRIFIQRFLGINSNLLRLDFLSGFLSSFFHSTKCYS